MSFEYAGPGYIEADDPHTCRYCPDHPIMDRVSIGVYECAECAYELNLESLEETGDE